MSERTMASYKIIEQRVGRVKYKIEPVTNTTKILYKYFGRGLAALTLVNMGRVTSFPDHVSHTLGANPCFAGATFCLKSKGIYIFHSMGTDIPSELQRLIDGGEVEGGIVGGNSLTYGILENSMILGKAGIQVVPPPNGNDYLDFSVISIPNEARVFFSYQTTE